MASIHLELTDEMEKEIDEGPLATTNGRGKSAYVRKLIQADLSNYRGRGREIGKEMSPGAQHAP